MSNHFTSANRGLSAMPAEEYILIVPFANHLQSGLNEPACRQAGKSSNRL